MREFDENKIKQAIIKVFVATESSTAIKSERIEEISESLTSQVLQKLSLPSSSPIHIEKIQDVVELVLMDNYHEQAKAYILYREKRNEGRHQPLYVDERIKSIRQAISSISKEDASGAKVLELSKREMYENMAVEDYFEGLIIAAKTLVESDPNYSYVAAQILLEKLNYESSMLLYGEYTKYQPKQHFIDGIHRGVSLGLIDENVVKKYDLSRLADTFFAKRDKQFTYLGLRTLYDRYFLRHNKSKNSVPFEMPQSFFMRVAMGLASNEKTPNLRAIEFYRLLSSFDFMSSTPTLFNSCTVRPQLSSCYLSTVHDSIEGIFTAIKDNAHLSKYAGGLGNDWTRIRGHGSYIQDTNGRSNGLIPFLKIANDTAVAVNQGGKRKGAVCSYLETWHKDIESYLELRKNTGDDRMRTHDMNTANWIPDLFMKRVQNRQKWTLFSPDEVPDLHDLYGKEFEERYEYYEKHAELGKMNSKKVNAEDLWRKMLSMVYETGHPRLCFKDPCNYRSPQRHCGVVHSSNLCTEITLNTSDEEIAVCNLGSINLAQHVSSKGLMWDKIEVTIETAVRMLDNVIEYNFYAVDKAKRSNLKHRPIGLGIMGFQDALYKLGIPYDSDEAVRFADTSMEIISYYAIRASCDLAKEKGVYSSFKGSLWDQGIMPIDSLKQFKRERGDGYHQFDTGNIMDWGILRKRVQKYGMRNSNVLAIAPTATIANICGVTQSIEPIFENLFVKSSLSGEFTVVNTYLVEDLKELNLWDDTMVNDIKFNNGSVQNIARIPDVIKNLYKTAFEIDSKYLISCAARRQKWLDQSQSFNIYVAEPSGWLIDSIYKTAWLYGLKTTYYLRSKGATHAEKSTMKPGDKNALNAVSCEVCE